MQWKKRITLVNIQYHREFYVVDKQTPATNWALYWIGTDDLAANWRILEAHPNQMQMSDQNYFSGAQIHRMFRPRVPYVADGKRSWVTPKRYQWSNLHLY